MRRLNPYALGTFSSLLALILYAIGMVPSAAQVIGRVHGGTASPQRLPPNLNGARRMHLLIRCPNDIGNPPSITYGASVRQLAARLCNPGIRATPGAADFSKSISVFRGVPTNAAATWYYLNCTTSGGLGSYVVNIAPQHGVVTFDTIDAPVPGCPAGSPPLPASQAIYKWTDPHTQYNGDSFELYYELNGQVQEVLDITVILNTPSCTITPTDEATVPKNRTRTRLGIGEAVDLVSSEANVTWSLSLNDGYGSVSQTGASSATFIAPLDPFTTVVTATPANGDPGCSLAFTTIEPDGLLFYYLPDFSYKYHNSIHFLKPVFGYWAAVLLTPADVNFQNSRVFEQETDKIGPGTQPTDHIIETQTHLKGFFLTCDKLEAVGNVDQEAHWLTEDTSQAHQHYFAATHKVGGTKSDMTHFLLKHETGPTIVMGDGEAYFSVPDDAPQHDWIAPKSFSDCFDHLPPNLKKLN